MASAARVKFEADLAYSRRDFEKAKEKYLEILEQLGKQKAASMRRDVNEGLARCCLKLGQNDEAEEWAQKLHSTSRLTNPDHLTVSHTLLAEVAAAASPSHGLERLSHLFAVARCHPYSPAAWRSAGECYLAMSDRDCSRLPLSAKMRVPCAGFCLVRAHVLLKTVEKSVKSFAKEANARDLAEVKERVSGLGLSLEEVDRIEMFASMDVFNRKKEGGDAAESEKGYAAAKKEDDFQDLGRSARLRAIEDSYATSASEEDGSSSSSSSEAVEVVSAFEKEWMSFLVE